MKARIHVWIYGDIHGVFFRMAIRTKANLLGITGWVKNVPEGIEALFEGEKENVESLINFCHEGPEGAFVDRVKTQEGKYRGDFRDFGIKER